MNDIIKAFQLVEEEKYKEAYEAFSNLINDKALENDARYSRAMIDISRLKEHFENTINDLKELINKKTKYAKISYSFLTLVYDELDMIDEVIKYGNWLLLMILHLLMRFTLLYLDLMLEEELLVI